MTPQERDLITALLARLRQQSNLQKDPEAEALIGQGVRQQPDAPYLLVQTVLIQDMALQDAQTRLADLEHQLAAAKAAPPQQAPQPTSFLGGAGRGSVPAAGPWHAAPPPPAAPGAGPVWTQSGAGAAAPPPSPYPYGSPGAAAGPGVMAGAGSSFLRQAATTAAGVAGGALLFQGIESLFGPHYGGGFLSGVPAQPSVSETVVNNYYGDQNPPDAGDGGQSADFTPDANQDYGQDQGGVTGADYGSDQDVGSDDGGGFDDSNFDV